MDAKMKKLIKQYEDVQKELCDLVKTQNQLNKTAKAIINRIAKVRNRCAHNFPLKTPGFMGRGICTKCGESDY